MSHILILFWGLCLSNSVFAQSQGILNGENLKLVTLEESVSGVLPGSIVIIGENHGFKKHQNQQLQIMQALRMKGLKVSVGLEFFTFTQQDQVNQYRSGTISEKEFLEAIQWNGVSFDFYRDQANFSLSSEGAQTLALNAPRSLTGKVSKLGLSALNDQERALLPPLFELGRGSYEKRFKQVMGEHLPDATVVDKYFAAQSIWDDTMAWIATNYIKAHPENILVIIVGEFHVQYGGGLPDRIRQRNSGIPIFTFSQINTEGLTEEEIFTQVHPSVEYGPRAHYILL